MALPNRLAGQNWSESLQQYIPISLPRTSSAQVFWLAIMVKQELSICMARLITYPPPLAELIPIGSAVMAILLRLSLPSGFPAITWRAILRVVICLVTPRIVMGSRTRKPESIQIFLCAENYVSPGLCSGNGFGTTGKTAACSLEQIVRVAVEIECRKSRDRTR